MSVLILFLMFSALSILSLSASYLGIYCFEAQYKWNSKRQMSLAYILLTRLFIHQILKCSRFYFAIAIFCCKYCKTCRNLRKGNRKI